MQTDQWDRHKGTVGLVKPGEGVQRDFLEEGVNEVVQRMADPGRRIRTTSGREERLVLLLGGVSRWVGPLQGRMGEAAECPSPVRAGAWGGIRSQASAPGALLLPSTALLCFSGSGWRPAFCGSCCRWQQKPDKARLFRAARGEEMSSGPCGLQPLLLPGWLDWQLRGVWAGGSRINRFCIELESFCRRVRTLPRRSMPGESDLYEMDSCRLQAPPALPPGEPERWPEQGHGASSVLVPDGRFDSSIQRCQIHASPPQCCLLRRCPRQVPKVLITQRQDSSVHLLSRV